MSRAFYPLDVTRFSHEVMEGLRALDRETKGLSLLGGWAVHALVDEAHRMQSQDVDVVVHHAAAWERTEPWLRSKGFAWRTFGRGERDNAFVHEAHGQVRVDFFFGRRIPDEIPLRLFNTRWMATIKDVPYEGFVPSLRTVLLDKLETLPKRPDPAKALKDALDAGNLLFHNVEGQDPRELMTESVKRAARSVLPHLVRLREPREHARFVQELDDLAAFLGRHAR